jgi:hypothetical protein
MKCKNGNSEREYQDRFGKPARATTNICSPASTATRSIPTEPAMTSRNGAVTSAVPSALTLPTKYHKSRRNVLDVDADAVPAQGTRRVGRGDRQL